jgi:hypothetical protein
MIGLALSGIGVDAQTLNEAQQQLDSVQQTVDTVGQQVQSVKEKGLLQTIWDNTVGIFFTQLSEIWQQILGIFGSIFGSKA